MIETKTGRASTDTPPSDVMYVVSQIRAKEFDFYGLVPAYAMYKAEHMSGEKPKNFYKALAVIERGSLKYRAFPTKEAAEAFIAKEPVFTEAFNRIGWTNLEESA